MYITTDVIPISPNSQRSTVIAVVVQYFGMVRWRFDGGSGGSKVRTEHKCACTVSQLNTVMER